MMLNEQVQEDWTTLIHQHPHPRQKEQNIQKNPAVQDKELVTIVVQTIRGLEEKKIAGKQELQSYMESTIVREKAQRRKNQQKK